MDRHERGMEKKNEVKMMERSKKRFEVFGGVSVMYMKPEIKNKFNLLCNICLYRFTRVL